MSKKDYCLYYKCWCEDMAEVTDCEYTCSYNCMKCKECIRREKKIEIKKIISDLFNSFKIYVNNIR